MSCARWWMLLGNIYRSHSNLLRWFYSHKGNKPTTTVSTNMYKPWRITGCFCHIKGQLTKLHQNRIYQKKERKKESNCALLLKKQPSNQQKKHINILYGMYPTVLCRHIPHRISYSFDIFCLCHCINITTIFHHVLRENQDEILLYVFIFLSQQHSVSLCH